eukprot:gene9384-9548_t
MGCQTRTCPAPPTAHDLQLIESGQGCMGHRGCVILRVPHQLAGQVFVLHDMSDCTVLLLGQLSALRLQQLQRCRVVAGPVSGATSISGAQDCLFMIASHQVRVHDAQGCDLYLRVRSRPVIEDSSQLRFAPFPGQLWQQVDDFGWVKSSQSPNWSVLPPTERQLPSTPGDIAGLRLNNRLA